MLVMVIHICVYIYIYMYRYTHIDGECIYIYIRTTYIMECYRMFLNIVLSCVISS